MICGDASCGCAIESATLDVSGAGTPEDPWVIEQIEFANLTDIENAVAGILAALGTLPGDYVNVTGDEMSGPLTLATAGSGLIIKRTDAEQPYVAFYRNADNTRIGYIMASDVEGYMRIVGDTGVGIRFLTNSTLERMRMDPAGHLMIAKTVTSLASVGIEMSQLGWIFSTRDTVGSNIWLNKTGAGDVDAARFDQFHSAGTEIGSITRATASTVGFNTSSDEDLKLNIVEIDDQIALYWMRIVQPMLFEFIVSPGVVQGGYIAQHVAAAWPESVALGIVTPGYGDIELRTWDEDGNETTPDGVWRGWQIDLSKFVPYIHAGLQAVDVRVTILEDLAAEHNDRIVALETEVISLRDDLTALQAVVVALSNG